MSWDLDPCLSSFKVFFSTPFSTSRNITFEFELMMEFRSKRFFQLPHRYVLIRWLTEWRVSITEKRSHWMSRVRKLAGTMCILWKVHLPAEIKSMGLPREVESYVPIFVFFQTQSTWLFFITSETSMAPDTSWETDGGQGEERGLGHGDEAT